MLKASFKMSIPRLFALTLLLGGGLSPLMGESLEVSCSPASTSYSIPDRIGFAGMAAGLQTTSADLRSPTVIFAGGANFPYALPNAKTAEERGAKVFSNRVGVMYAPDVCSTCGSKPMWSGKLPYAVGYAASGAGARGLFIAGGCDAKEHLAKVTRVWLLDGNVRHEALPDLPRPVAYAASAQIGSKLYVLGGQEKPDDTTCLASNYVFDMDNPSAGWTTLPAMPSGRMLASAAVYKDKIYVMGGCSLHADAAGKAQRTYLKDMLVYDTKTASWQTGAQAQLPDMPETLVAIPSPLPVVDGRAFILGGDPGNFYRASLKGEAPSTHPGQSKTIYVYDFAKKSWSKQGETAVGVVTAPTVQFHRVAPTTLIVISGETHPGVRTPIINTISITPKY